MKLVLTFSLMIVFTALLLTGCNSATTSPTKEGTAIFDVSGMKQIIEGKDKDWAKAIITSDSAAMVIHFTKDGKIFPPNGDPIVGRTAIAAFVSEVNKFGIKEYKDETTALYGNEDNLVEEGNYTMGDGKGNRLDKGKYIAIWRKEDGDWKIYSNIYNTSLPPAPIKK
jgi:uncharacterized protein (TIGR02246 family)